MIPERDDRWVLLAGDAARKAKVRAAFDALDATIDLGPGTTRKARIALGFAVGAAIDLAARGYPLGSAVSAKTFPPDDVG